MSARRQKLSEKLKRFYWFDPRNLITKHVLTYECPEPDNPTRDTQPLSIRPRRGHTVRC